MPANPRDPLFHCVERGVRKADLFVTDEDKGFYTRQLGRLAREMGLFVALYVLMDNHFHILIRATRELVGKLFLRLNSIYAREFNRRHELRGHIFEAHFRPVPVDSPGHQAAAAIYIPMNPVKDLGVERPELFEYSSFKYFLDPSKKPDWIDVAPVLEAFSRDPAEGLRRYLREVEGRRVMVLRNRESYRGAAVRDGGKPYKPRPVAEFSDSELMMILDTLLDRRLKRRLAEQARLPSQAFVLYVAAEMKLGSVRRLAALLGINRTAARRYIQEIAEDAWLKGKLCPTGLFRD
jgi:REP element-mobilizing transposase RayT